MKKIIPFKQELLFKTKVSEITSISLEHKVDKMIDEVISGEFIINGEYKMTEGSINKEKYEFTLPFDIALNSKYDIDTVKVDIDNFYYEIVNNEVLKVNIDLLVEAEEKIEQEVIIDEDRNTIDEEETDNLSKNYDNIDINDNINLESNIDIHNEDNIDINIDNTNINNNQNNNVNTNIFDTIDNTETYSSYYVYIVKEEDTIDKILEKYDVTKEDLELYNNIDNIKPYDKIIIPTNGKWFKANTK